MDIDYKALKTEIEELKKAIEKINGHGKFDYDRFYNIIQQGAVEKGSTYAKETKNFEAFEESIKWLTTETAEKAHREEQNKAVNPTLHDLALPAESVNRHGYRNPKQTTATTLENIKRNFLPILKIVDTKAFTDEDRETIRGMIKTINKMADIVLLRRMEHLPRWVDNDPPSASTSPPRT